MFDKIVQFIREYYQKPEGHIALHEPQFNGNERKYVLDAIDSTFVSSVGSYVDRFESMVCDYTGAQFAIATTNGTTALHMSLLLAGVKRGELVITQPLSFIATCNAISYLGAEPLFIDIDVKTLGLSASDLELFLREHTVLKDGACIHKASGKKISACVPMHTFGHPVEIDKIVDICDCFNIALVEDAAESLGSTFRKRHTGTFGLLGIYSFNGNKTITCGGGGIIVTNNEKLSKLGKHLTTQAKLPHPWEFIHDRIGYNYRLPNLNAALACAQLEQLEDFIENKRALAKSYKEFFATLGLTFIDEPIGSRSNFWLNTILFNELREKEAFLKYSNEKGVMSRPAWELMPNLAMFKDCIRSDIKNARDISSRLVSLPSTPKMIYT